MKMKVFTVFDVKAQLHLQPFFEQSTETGIRAFKVVCQDSKTNFYMFPEDYSLIELGEWDQQQGFIKMHDRPMILAQAAEFKK